MESGDIQTFYIKRNSNGAFVKNFELDWLRFMGFTDKELATEEIEIKLIAKAEVSENKKYPYLGIGRKRE